MIVEGEIDIPGAVFADRIAVMSTGAHDRGTAQRRFYRGRSRRPAPGSHREVRAPAFSAESIDLPDDENKAEAA